MKKITFVFMCLITNEVEHFSYVFLFFVLFIHNIIFRSHMFISRTYLVPEGSF